MVKFEFESERMYRMHVINAESIVSVIMFNRESNRLLKFYFFF